MELNGRYLDIEMMTQLALQTQIGHTMTETQNDKITDSLTYKLWVISLFKRSEKPRKKVSVQSEKIT